MDRSDVHFWEGCQKSVKRTGEAVFIDDAGSDERFAADSYLILQKPKSIGCIPIINQANLLGILGDFSKRISLN
jgi:GAF domain-containing protein